MGAVLGCQPVSSRLISICLRAAPFNITIIQVYAPTSGHDDSEVDHFYQKLQETIAGIIRVREMSGKFKIFQGQGIVREFHNLSGKIEILLKCQGNVREF